MCYQGINYYLTKHGRKRFKQRVFDTDIDALIILSCLVGIAKTRAIWKPCGYGYRLVTVK